MLEREQMLQLAEEAATIGFKRVGVTGGEPFLRKDMPDVLADLAEILPVVVLSNGSLFTEQLVERMRPLAELPVSVQISLDYASADSNDRLRKVGNFDSVLDALPKLIELGVRVRIATTGNQSDQDRSELCALHRSLGIEEEDHIVRPVIDRGRATDLTMGVVGNADSLPPELTITSEGAFWSPFAPTVRNGSTETDLLLTRTILPLRKPAEVLLRLVQGRPTGADATLGIR